jgi:hypothetical protein
MNILLLFLDKITTDILYVNQGHFQLVCTVRGKRILVDLKLLEQTKVHKNIGRYMRCVEHAFNRLRV